ncbi:MAG: hypothetical protein Q9184_001850 [Pyrenodesmia sp. 2 TL-2023]
MAPIRRLSCQIAFRFSHQVRFTPRSSQYRRLSTFKTVTGRVLAITKDITPASHCNCDIQFPSGLRIDHDRPLINTVASYNQHIVIATGKNDWASKIESEEGVGEMARALKDMTKVKGEWFDPNYSTLISNSSFTPHPNSQDSSTPTAMSPSDPNRRPSESSTSLKLFPHFLHFPHVTNSPAHRSYFASTYLGDHTISPETIPDPPSDFTPPVPITKPTILICSHGSRDMRCGVLGPLLHHEFERHNEDKRLDVGMISHIGGHAFAGNVIIYIPPEYPLSDGRRVAAGAGKEMSPLVGMGIWYGRVEPRHVTMILEETVKKGNIIRELWRGGLDVDVKGRDWKERATGAKIMRIPTEVLHEGVEEGNVVEETGGEGYAMDTERRVQMMGLRAKERWEGRQP